MPNICLSRASKHVAPDSMTYEYNSLTLPRNVGRYVGILNGNHNGGGGGAVVAGYSSGRLKLADSLQFLVSKFGSNTTKESSLPLSSTLSPPTITLTRGSAGGGTRRRRCDINMGDSTLLTHSLMISSTSALLNDQSSSLKKQTKHPPSLLNDLEKQQTINEEKDQQPPLLLFPKLHECAHFHYDYAEIGIIKLILNQIHPIVESSTNNNHLNLNSAACKLNLLFDPANNKSSEKWHLKGEPLRIFEIQIVCASKSWCIQRSFQDFDRLDKCLHKCLFFREYSQLTCPLNLVTELQISSYFDRLATILSQNTVNCAHVLNWFEMDNRGNHVLTADDVKYKLLNSQAIGAAVAVKRYAAKNSTEISFEIGDIISILSMEPESFSSDLTSLNEIIPLTRNSKRMPEVSSFYCKMWKGKHGFQVGYFPSNLVQLYPSPSNKMNISVPSTTTTHLNTNEGVRGALKNELFIRQSNSKRPVTNTTTNMKKNICHGTSNNNSQQQPPKVLLSLIGSFLQFFLTARPEKPNLRALGILKERVFGCDLGEYLCNHNNISVPPIVRNCCDWIEIYGITDGIYRLSGLSSNVQKLRNIFDEERIPIWPRVSDDSNDGLTHSDLIHSYASVLKMYFRELPNPLLTYNLYQNFLNLVKPYLKKSKKHLSSSPHSFKSREMENGDKINNDPIFVHEEGNFSCKFKNPSKDILMKEFRKLLLQLPPPHFTTASFLFNHLNKLASFTDKTSMHAKNLAIVWAPNILRNKDLPLHWCQNGTSHVVTRGDFSNKIRSSPQLSATPCTNNNINLNACTQEILAGAACQALAIEFLIENCHSIFNLPDLTKDFDDCTTSRAPLPSTKDDNLGSNNGISINSDQISLDSTASQAPLLSPIDNLETNSSKLSDQISLHSTTIPTTSIQRLTCSTVANLGKMDLTKLIDVGDGIRAIPRQFHTVIDVTNHSRFAEFRAKKLKQRLSQTNFTATVRDSNTQFNDFYDDDPSKSIKDAENLEKWLPLKPRNHIIIEELLSGDEVTNHSPDRFNQINSPESAHINPNFQLNNPDLTITEYSQIKRPSSCRESEDSILFNYSNNNEELKKIETAVTEPSESGPIFEISREIEDRGTRLQGNKSNKSPIFYDLHEISENYPTSTTSCDLRKVARENQKILQISGDLQTINSSSISNDFYKISPALNTKCVINMTVTEKNVQNIANKADIGCQTDINSSNKPLNSHVNQDLRRLTMSCTDLSTLSNTNINGIINDMPIDFPSKLTVSHNTSSEVVSRDNKMEFQSKPSYQKLDKDENSQPSKRNTLAGIALLEAFDNLEKFKNNRRSCRNFARNTSWNQRPFSTFYEEGSQDHHLSNQSKFTKCFSIPSSPPSSTKSVQSHMCLNYPRSSLRPASLLCFDNFPKYLRDLPYVNQDAAAPNNNNNNNKEFSNFRSILKPYGENTNGEYDGGILKKRHSAALIAQNSHFEEGAKALVKRHVEFVNLPSLACSEQPIPLTLDGSSSYKPQVPIRKPKNVYLPRKINGENEGNLAFTRNLREENVENLLKISNSSTNPPNISTFSRNSSTNPRYLSTCSPNLMVFTCEKYAEIEEKALNYQFSPDISSIETRKTRLIMPDSAATEKMTVVKHVSSPTHQISTTTTAIGYRKVSDLRAKFEQKQQQQQHPVICGISEFHEATDADEFSTPANECFPPDLPNSCWPGRQRTNIKTNAFIYKMQQQRLPKNDLPSIHFHNTSL